MCLFFLILIGKVQPSQVTAWTTDQTYKSHPHPDQHLWIRCLSLNDLHTIILQAIETSNHAWVITKLPKHIMYNCCSLNTPIHFIEMSSVHPADMRKVTLEPAKCMLNKYLKL